MVKRYSLEPMTVEFGIEFPGGETMQVRHVLRRMTCLEELETMRAQHAEAKLAEIEFIEAAVERKCRQYDQLSISVEGYDFGSHTDDWRELVPADHKVEAYNLMTQKKGWVERPDLRLSTNSNGTVSSDVPAGTTATSPATPGVGSTPATSPAPAAPCGEPTTPAGSGT